mmetsp:Transcript_10434/g.29695  ORF Transcript_10434/g.29695 Transcript_10434/m.29695 type:complete len:150 (-) Transcript_10434:156-605(-)
MSSGVSMVLVLQKADAINAWRGAIGPTDSEEARRTAPKSLRAVFGTDTTRNGFHGSDSKESAIREIGFFFPHRQGVGSVPPQQAPAKESQEGKLTMESLDGLTKDEIFNSLLKEAAVLGEEIEAIVERLNREQGQSNGAPPASIDHSDL